MSQFISSFLIEPVVRQARRFSRTEVESGADSRSERDGLDEAYQIPVTSDDGTIIEAEEEQEEQGHSRSHIQSTHNGNLIDDDESNPSQTQPSASSNTSVDSSNGQSLQSRTGPPGPAVTVTGGGREPFPRTDTGGLTSAHRASSPTPIRALGENLGHSRRSRAGTDPRQTPAAGSLARLLPGQPQSRPFNASYPTSINEASLRFHELGNPEMQTGTTGGIVRPAPATRPTERVRRHLPEDDGMSAIRRRILAIQQMNISSTEKSRKMHELMTERYSSSLPVAQLPSAARAHSPVSSQGPDCPLTPNSTQSVGLRFDGESPETSNTSFSEEFTVAAIDQKPTFWTSSGTEPDHTAGAVTPTTSRRNSADAASSNVVFGCQHYKRNVKLQCSQCFRWYTCRFCHDSVEDHALIRKDTKNMLCMLCGAAQPAAGECRGCGESAACYYCDVCKLWDNEPTRSIYHCDDCGICRVGKGLGKDFFHCKTCLACLAISIRDTHRCIERSTDCDCPICGEYMFTSPQTVVFMRCGHSIHYTCYKRHMQSSFKCPICNRSVINMEMSFRNLDSAIEAQPMPPEFRDTKAWISCNDCCGKSSVAYHWLGLKCGICDSYNTVQIRMSTTTVEAAQAEVVAQDSPEATAAVSIAAEAMTAHAQGADTPPTHDLSVRGRVRGVVDRVPRTATSVSALNVSRQHSLLSATLIPRFGRSLSANDQIPTREASPEHGVQSGEASHDASDDEVEFWGGESPRDRALWFTADGDSDYTDEEDLDMDLDDEEEDSSDDDVMDILGHR